MSSHHREPAAAAAASSSASGFDPEPYCIIAPGVQETESQPLVAVAAAAAAAHKMSGDLQLQLLQG